jgi:hypothetical protein
MMTTGQAAKSVATDAYSHGRNDAREWLKTPHSKPLAALRLEYQDKVLNACEWGSANAPHPQATATGIFDSLAMYGAGIDSVIEAFILPTISAGRGAKP